MLKYLNNLNFTYISIFRQRENRLRMQQVALRDAPDPRESRPPCYSDAIRMPRIDGSFASLNELSSDKRRKRKENDQNESDSEDVPIRRVRCRSEEVLSMRESVRRVPPRVHPFEVEQLDRQTFVDDEIENVRIQGSNVILNLEYSPRSTRARPSTTPGRADISENFNENENEEIRNFNQSSNSVNRSPYSRRSKKEAKSDDVEIVDDHFASEQQHLVNDENGSMDSSDFITVEARKSQSQSSSEEDFVVLRNNNNSNNK